MSSGESDSGADHSLKGTPPNGGVLASAIAGVLSGLNAIGSVWILVLVALINFDAFGRTFFAAPVNGGIEIIELSLVAVVFLQLGDATRRGRLTRSDGFFALILERRPGIGRVMGVTFDLLGAIFMLLVLYGTVPLLIESVREEHYAGVEGLVTIPIWPVRLVVVVGAAVTALQFLVFAWRYLIPSSGSR